MLRKTVAVSSALISAYSNIFPSTFCVMIEQQNPTATIIVPSQWPDVEAGQSPAPNKLTHSTMREPCKICGTVTKSICYKLYVCGACTMFYRRNYRFWGRLTCRMNGDCNLKAGALNDRRTCRPCRLRACRDLGLRMIGKSLVVQQDGLPEDDILEPDESRKPCTCQGGKCCKGGEPAEEDAESGASTSAAEEGRVKREPDHLDHSPSTPSSCHTPQQSAASQIAREVAISMVDQPQLHQHASFRPFTEYQQDVAVGFHELDHYPHLTHLRRVVDVFKRVRERQKAIVKEVLRYEVDLEPEPPRQPPAQVLSMQFPVMERMSSQFCCMAIVEFLQGCEGLSIDEKVAIMRPVMLNISLIFKMYLTCRRHPAIGDTNLAMYTGISNNLAKYDVYMSDLLNVLGAQAYLKHYNKSKTLVEPFFKKLVALMDRFRDFKPCIVEFAYLACMSVYEQMESVQIQHILAMRLRDKLCSELSMYLADRFPPHVVSVRIMRLSTLLYGVRQIDEQYEDMFNLLGVLIPENRHHDFQKMPDVFPDQLHQLATQVEVQQHHAQPGYGQ